MERRNTRQRQQVLEAVRALDHPDADEICAALAGQKPRAGRATVYRNLNLLAEQGEIRRIETGGADRYDGCLRPHYHLRCRCCGRLFDAHMPVVEGLEKQLTDTGGFAVEGYTIVFVGLCPDCNKNLSGGR